MRLVATASGARAAWALALAADPGAVVSQTPEWLDAACASARLRDATRAYETDDGRLVVLPLARARALPAGLAPVASLPFGWGTGGLVGADIRGADVAHVLRDLASSTALRLDLRPPPHAHDVWSGAVPRQARRIGHMAQVVDLDGWEARCSSKVRRWCRKAERLGVEVEWDDGGRLVATFDVLYRRSVARWAEQQHEPVALARARAHLRDPPRKFEHVAAHLGAACRVGVASRDGEPAAAIIVLWRGLHTTYWRGAMDKALASRTGANELLHTQAMAHAEAAGARHYHMGDSAPGSSLAEFKRGFGAREEHYDAYRLERVPLTALRDGAAGIVKRALRFRET